MGAGEAFLDSKLIGKMSGLLKDTLALHLKAVLIYIRLHCINLDGYSAYCIFFPIDSFSNVMAAHSQIVAPSSHVSTGVYPLNLIVKSIWPSTFCLLHLRYFPQMVIESSLKFDKEVGYNAVLQFKCHDIS